MIRRLRPLALATNRGEDRPRFSPSAFGRLRPLLATWSCALLALVGLESTLETAVASGPELGRDSSWTGPLDFRSAALRNPTGLFPMRARSFGEPGPATGERPSTSRPPVTLAFGFADQVGGVGGGPAIGGGTNRSAQTGPDPASRSGRPHSAGDVWNDLTSALSDNLSDFGHIYSSPARIDRRTGLWLGGILAVGGVLYAFDQEVYDALKRNEFETPYRWVRDTGEFFEPVGLQGNINKYLIGGMVLGYATGLDPVTTITSDILRSFLISAPGKSAANELFGRRGPKLERGARSFVFADGRSFPSGHSLAIATVARVVTYRIPYWPVQALAYTMMGTVLLQRVTSDAHWPTDAYFGGLYGWYVTDELLRRRDERGVRLVPTSPADGVGMGLGLRLRWL